MSAADTGSSGHAESDPRKLPFGRGFLDAASGIPMTADTRKALEAALDLAWSDPTRRYPAARHARRVLDSARASLASSLGAPADGVLLAGSAEQAVQWALTGWGDRKLLVSAVEELSVLRTCDALQRDGTEVEVLPVDRLGSVDPRQVAAAAASAPAGAVVVVQDVNIEVGTRQPLARLRALLPPGTPLVVDARGSVGRERHTDHWDALVADARLWGGPGGCAVLAVRDPAALRPVAVTDGPLGLEPADPPVALAAAAAWALAADPARHEDRLRQTSRVMRRRVLASIGDAEVVGGADSAWITMFTFLYVAADELIDQLARRGWSCASGASCTADTRRPHHVLTAIAAATHGSLRVSLPPWADEATIGDFVTDLTDVVAALRRDAGVADL